MSAEATMQPLAATLAAVLIAAALWATARFMARYATNDPGGL